MTTRKKVTPQKRGRHATPRRTGSATSQTLRRALEQRDRGLRDWLEVGPLRVWRCERCRES